MKPIELNKEYILDRVKINKDTNCWEWLLSKDNWWYWRCKNKWIVDRIHRISYKVFVWEIPKWLLVCHKCDNPICCNPEHLFLWTHIDNMNDMVSKWRNKTCWKSHFWNNFWWKRVLAWGIQFKSFRDAWKYFWITDNWIKKRIKLNWEWYSYI